ncbi:MAG TPA: hypothetical protein VHR66_03595 [Gemmataceae bacterium]|nr:hypothetical protein [Gemmataceae bacterium]
MARPKKPPGEGRDKLLQVRLQEGEYISFKEAAARSGLDLSAWIRERLAIAASKEVRRSKKRPHSEKTVQS